MHNPHCTIRSEFGIRSASSGDARYSNADYIDPYSNWRGPIWINTNVMIAYGLAGMGGGGGGSSSSGSGSGSRGGGMGAHAVDIATRVVALLAASLRRQPELAKNGTAWRECYSSDDGKELAAPGFMSWNLLAGTVLPSLRAGTNPFDLSYA